ncbi:hypothetical protein L7F22_053731 [Adiantum nelumboides]|nr:hypothetical protein [Adiantum nelumboides]
MHAWKEGVSSQSGPNLNFIEGAIALVLDSQAPLDVHFEEGEPPIPQQHQEGQSSKQGEALESSIQAGDEDVREEVGTIIEGNFFRNWLEDHCVDKEARLPPVPISKLKINPVICTHDDQIELLHESFIHSYGYQPSLGEFIVSESFPVFLFMFHRAAEVSIPRTPLHDIFMMQRLGLADSTSIVARLERALRDWALKHMKNKSQAQNWSKWVRIPVAFIAQLVWKNIELNHLPWSLLYFMESAVFHALVAQAHQRPSSPAAVEEWLTADGVQPDDVNPIPKTATVAMRQVRNDVRTTASTGGAGITLWPSQLGTTNIFKHLEHHDQAAASLVAFS